MRKAVGVGVVVMALVGGLLSLCLCRLRGHVYLTVREPRRVFARCVECGHETPGWAVGPLGGQSS